MSRKISAISLFSGCGGCSLGLKNAGIDVIYAIDNNRDACSTYEKNFGKNSIINSDILKFTPEEIQKIVHAKYENIDLIVGGPPCQGFSSAGTKDWTDPRNNLLRYFSEIVTSIKPTWFIMENVEGLLTSNGGYYINEAIIRFIKAGYWVNVKKIYMEKYGLPQKRKRVFVIGNLERCIFNFPEYSHFSNETLSFYDNFPIINILDAISDLPPPNPIGPFFQYLPDRNEFQKKLQYHGSNGVDFHNNKELNEIWHERIINLKQGESMKNLPSHLQHESFRRRAFRRVKDGTPTEKRGGAPSGVKRLISNEPSLTITSASTTEFVHPIDNRFLTIRECARIQSYPDWFSFCGNNSSVITQIANAIPPLIMEKIAHQIIETASWNKVDSTKGKLISVDVSKSSGMSPALLKMLSDLKNMVANA